jgi:hypothetical protein
VSTVMSISVPLNVLEYLSDWQILDKDSAPWI